MSQKKNNTIWKKKKHFNGHIAQFQNHLTRHCHAFTPEFKKIASTKDL